MAIVKLAADGTFVWGRTFAGTDDTSHAGAAVAVDVADAVYIGGYYQSTFDFDPGPGTAVRTAAARSGVIVKLTAGGDFSWVQSIDDGPCLASLSSVAVATDGAVWGIGLAEAGPNCTYGSPSASPSAGKALIASYGAAGDARGVWTLADDQSTAISGEIVTAGDGAPTRRGGRSKWTGDPGTRALRPASCSCHRGEGCAASQVLLRK
jgi:hypothetical protein